MFGTVPVAYRLLGGIVLLGGVFVGGVFIGWRGPHNALVQYRAEVAQAAADQDRIAQAKDAENERLKKETEDAYQTILANNTNYWNNRLRDYKGSCGLPKASTTASGVNETTKYSLPDYEKLIMDCQATTVQLEALQKWIKETR